MIQDLLPRLPRQALATLLALTAALWLAGCCSLKPVSGGEPLPFKLTYLLENDEAYGYFNNRVFTRLRPHGIPQELRIAADSISLQDSMLFIGGKVLDAISRQEVSGVEIYVSTIGSYTGTVTDLEGHNPQPVMSYRINDTPYRAVTDSAGAFVIRARLDPDSKLFLASMKYQMAIYDVGRLVAL